MLRTPVCSYPIIVTHLSFNFLCLVLLYSIYLNAMHVMPNEKSGIYSRTNVEQKQLCIIHTTVLSTSSEKKRVYHFSDQWGADCNVQYPFLDKVRSTF
jgi:hypothetical protein